MLTLADPGGKGIPGVQTASLLYGFCDAVSVTRHDKPRNHLFNGAFKFISGIFDDATDELLALKPYYVFWTAT